MSEGPMVFCALALAASLLCMAHAERTMKDALDRYEKAATLLAELRRELREKP